MIRDAGYLQQGPREKRTLSVPEGSALQEQVQLQGGAAGIPAAALSSIFWGGSSLDIRWGGSPRGERDELPPPPAWTISEPGWHPRPGDRPNARPGGPALPVYPTQRRN
jgi:hypothetical protein